MSAKHFWTVRLTVVKRMKYVGGEERDFRSNVTLGVVATSVIEAIQTAVQSLPEKEQPVVWGVQHQHSVDVEAVT